MSSTFEPKWTPGPWSIDGDACGAGVTQVADARDENGYYVRLSTVLRVASYPAGDSNEQEWIMDNMHQDLALIALAPELATAVLAWHDRMIDDLGFDTDLDRWHPNFKELWGLAERLRMIGADE